VFGGGAPRKLDSVAESNTVMCPGVGGPKLTALESSASI
jgi:hypothetical protein